MTVYNNKGFTNIFLLLVLPSLLTLLTLVYYIVFLIELKNEFRFVCITESLRILKTASEQPTSSVAVLKEIFLLLQKLKLIRSPLNFSVRLLDYPKSEAQTLNNRNLAVVYQLKTKSQHLKYELNCGAQLFKKELTWHYQIIYEILYETKMDKF